MALTVLQYEDIVALLERVPPLVDKLEARSSAFANDVVTWLKDVEGACESNKLAIVSQVATNRAMLIEAARGVKTDGVVIAGRPTVRKLRDGTASMVLQTTSDLLHAEIAERKAAFQEAERMARQIIAVAEVKGMLEGLGNGRSHQEVLSSLRDQIAADADLAAVYVHLISIVGKTDVLIFFDRALPAVGVG